MFTWWCAGLMVSFALFGCGSDEPSGPVGGAAGAAVGGMAGAAAGSGGGSVAGMTGGAAGCGSAALTYAAFGAVFFADHCNMCHGAGVKAPNGLQPPATATFSNEADLIRLRDKIRKAAITDKWMPPGAPLSECLSEQLSKYLDTLPPP